MTAEEVVDKISHGGGMFDTWSADIRLTLGLSEINQVVVMIKGLHKYYMKTKMLANREFTAAARAGLDGLSGAEREGSAAAALSTRPTKEVIERELVKLQVEQGCFLVHGQSILAVSRARTDDREQ